MVIFVGEWALFIDPSCFDFMVSFKMVHSLLFIFLILIGGSGYCKYGWSKYAAPSGRCATFLVSCGE
jgi:hypothetical protein